MRPRENCYYIVCPSCSTPSYQPVADIDSGAGYFCLQCATEYPSSEQRKHNRFAIKIDNPSFDAKCKLIGLCPGRIFHHKHNPNEFTDALYCVETTDDADGYFSAQVINIQTGNISTFIECKEYPLELQCVGFEAFRIINGITITDNSSEWDIQMAMDI